MVSGFQVFIDTIFNPVFGWMLNIPPIVAIIVLATVLAFISTLLQKYMTDQAKMKRYKDDTKKMQEQLKKVRDDPQKVMKLQQKMMPIQMDMMKESFKPLLVTLIPFLLVFFWLSNHFAYYQIQPNQDFTVSATYGDGIAGVATLYGDGLMIAEPEQTIKDGATKWTLKGPAGEHKLVLGFAGANYTRDLLISSDRIYETPLKPFSGSVTTFNVDNQSLIPLPWVNLFGWHPGWIFYYIIFSIPLSLLLKKWLNVV